MSFDMHQILVLKPIDEIDLVSADFSVVHFNEPDTFPHPGPDAEKQFGSGNMALGVIDTQPSWDDLLIVM